MQARSSAESARSFRLFLMFGQMMQSFCSCTRSRYSSSVQLLMRAEYMRGSRMPPGFSPPLEEASSYSISRTLASSTFRIFVASAPHLSRASSPSR